MTHARQMAKLLILVVLVCCLSFSLHPVAGLNTVTYDGKIYIHWMPWFETKQSSGTNKWGIHWTMNNQNPDIIIDGTGKRQIAAHYYPEIGPYASGDPNVIEYQLGLMQYAGVDGVLIDWPGTIQAKDYPKNLQNAEALIKRTEAYGLQFAIVYEDHNVGIAYDEGLISNKIQAAQKDMTYIRDNYFNKPNYIKINGSPLLLDFGPQTFKQPSDWTAIFSQFNQKPTFLTLWYQNHEAGENSSGEYNWIYTDFMNGLRNFYTNRLLKVKMGVSYPGFNTFYSQGGWPGPGWKLPYDGIRTFNQTLDLAIQNNIQWIQIATWNDYGEGTMIEPTREFGNGFLNILQSKRGNKFSDRELNLVKKLYTQRISVPIKDKAKIAQLDQAAAALRNFNPTEAEKLLN